MDQPKIEKLTDAVADGMTPPRVDLSTTWNGPRLRANSLDGLRQAIDRCLQLGDSQRLETLELCASSGERHVRVRIGEYVATVSVEASEANDGAWAIGKAEQIRKILLHAHGSVRLPRWRPGLLALAGSIAALVGIGGALRVGLFPVDAGPVVLAVMVVGLVGISCYLVGRWRATNSRTVIWVAGALPRRGWVGWSTADRIAALALLVGFLGIIVTLLI